MHDYFTKIFAKQPDEIIDGDYYFHNLWYDDLLAESAVSSSGMALADIREKREKRYNSNFISIWKEKTRRGEFDLGADWSCVEFEEIINKIAADGKPFMDISSSWTMGLAPYVLKINPEIPCLVTDIDMHGTKLLRTAINEFLPEFDISLACFDNFDIPIKDCSLDYITGISGIGSSCGKPLRVSASGKSEASSFPDLGSVIP